MSKLTKDYINKKIDGTSQYEECNLHIFDLIEELEWIKEKIPINWENLEEGIKPVMLIYMLAIMDKLNLFVYGDGNGKGN